LTDLNIGSHEVVLWLKVMIVEKNFPEDEELLWILKNKGKSRFESCLKNLYKD